MSKQPPYEQWDEQWSNGLGLPDADKAWGDMKDRLDAEDRKRRFGFWLPVLPCAGWTLLGIAVLGAGTWLLWPSGNSPAAPPVARSPLTNNTTAPDRETPAVATTNHASTPAPGAAPNPDHPVSTSPRSESIVPGTPSTTTQPGSASNTGSHPATIAGSPKATTMFSRPKASQAPTATRISTASTKPHPTKGTRPGNKTHDAGNTSNVTGSTGAPVAANITPAPVIGAQPAGTADSNSTRAQPPVATVTAPDSNATAAAPPAPPKKKGVQGRTFSAGLALHEALPVSGQDAWMKNYRGRSNPATEHIPSLWFRAERGRWTLGVEARFHAPQYVPDLVFAQKTRWDTGGHAVLTERQALRKIWYHHFGATVGFRILKGWSIGAGAQWSLLHQAYAERRYIWSDFGGNIQSISTEARPIGGFRDSFLYKTQWQLLLQTEYNWKRWTLGLRYRADLEPYIRYTRPGGAVTDRRNDAAEAILRFRLWQSKGKK